MHLQGGFRQHQESERRHKQASRSLIPSQPRLLRAVCLRLRGTVGQRGGQCCWNEEARPGEGHLGVSGHGAGVGAGTQLSPGPCPGHAGRDREQESLPVPRARLHPQAPSQQDQNLIYSLGLFLLYKSNHGLFFHIVNIVLNSCSWAIRLQASPGELCASAFWRGPRLLCKRLPFKTFPNDF